MKCFKLIIFILVIFSKTGNVLSETDLFNVNNIEIINQPSINNDKLTNQAIKKGFEELINRILLKSDKKKLEKLKFEEIKDLVAYYQVSDESSIENSLKKFNIFFDKDKLHNLFYNLAIPYADITKNEIFLLPILKKNDETYIYTQNYFYEKWNQIGKNELVEFILPIENIETLQEINNKTENLIDLEIKNIFKEYQNKNLALIIIELRDTSKEKIFLKTSIMEKKINKTLVIENSNLNEKEFYDKIIIRVKNELINLSKSQNLIDIRTPSFINTRFILNKKNSLVELNKRLRKIELVENLYVLEFNKEYVLLKIKYLGNINKIIKQLKQEKIILKLSGDIWSLSII